MGYERVWDLSCPRVWDTWESDGKAWVIQDLRPEDDAVALKILLEHIAAEEELCTQYNLMDDPVSVNEITEYWKRKLKDRFTLACYTEVDGVQTLVALNCCSVALKRENPQVNIKGKAWKKVYDVVNFMETQHDAFEYLETDKILVAMGLVVLTEYRGAKLGAKVLDAREPLCRSLGIKGTATMFTGLAAQKLAERCGFTTLFVASWADLADAGFDFPRHDRVIKYMVKKYL